MDPLSLQNIASLCGGELSGHSSELTAERISKDTRTLREGDLYLALHGENFDGNRFVAAAAQKGAVAAVIDGDVGADVPAGFPLIRVDNTLAALTRFAAEWRNQLRLRAVAITGSSGKTSTKEFASSVLETRFRVTRTEGNLNNHFGLPLSVLAASSVHDAAVWEIGMNHPGEIAPLAAIAQPDVAIITNIGIAHIEFFPDTGRDGIAAEKTALAEAVGRDGSVVIPTGDDYADFVAARTKAAVVRAGIGAGDVRGRIKNVSDTGTEFDVESVYGSVTAWLPVPGEHMVRNALLAIAAGLEFGLSLEECADGLRSAKLTGGRLQRRVVRGVHLLDDTYNANPDSMSAALQTLANLPVGGKRIAVLGRMGELGNHAESGYRSVGATAASSVEILIVVGGEAALIADSAASRGLKSIHRVPDTAAAAGLLSELASEGDLVLIKGSRAAKMEGVIERFEN